MNGAFVVDASVSAAWFLRDETTAYSEAALHATTSCEVWVPSLWIFEMTNLLLGAVKRRRITAAKRSELIAEAMDLRLQVDREPVAMSTLEAIASHHALSAYDAAYLELSIRKRIPLATLDEALKKAASSVGLQLASP